MKKFLIIAIALLSFNSCSESELVNESGEMTLQNIDLPDLGDGYEYRAWLLLDGTFVGVGSFTFNDFEQDAIVEFTNIDVTDLGNANAFAITVEDSSGSNAPSDFVLMVGDFDGNTATLSANQTTGQGVQTLLVNATAAITIQTPTTPSDSTDEMNGVWFFANDGTTDITTLALNFQNINDVEYHAYVRTTDADPISLYMGQISANEGADNSNLYIQANDLIPAFAGEDFLGVPSGSSLGNIIPLDVRGQEVIITASPTNAATDSPFAIELFSLMIPSDATTGSATANQLDLIQNTGFTATAVR